MLAILNKMTSKVQWDVKGVLLDITGVLYESGQGAIKGSVEAVEKLRQAKIPFRFVTNETQRTRPDLVTKLKSIGFSLSESEIFSPGIATSTYLKQMKLRPFLLVHPELLPEFSDCDQNSPNCVVIGDAAEDFSYENMNKAFQLLLKSENPVLISMGKGKYYKEKGEIVMDLGGFTAALEFSADCEAKIIGKTFS
ncbi:phospholysine phosphohistidine inorganic pyrophosphate phosphatase [Caerostris extrusa]|uniref:Phospholysine phosphohistidine inorganic pyrophosphate phosphatase n=1 Tax=Caerostris extrusa TaxID=172846 RepID=A0AAV4MWE2_CAEEX|nr:phospholysine phosphohistidine inorganic pyrophosphate phosphatase [Caerostris extrusa]